MVDVLTTRCLRQRVVLFYYHKIAFIANIKLMKNYSSKQAKRGKTAYRTPSNKHYQLVARNAKRRAK